VDKKDGVFLFKEGARQGSPNTMVQAAAIKTSHNAPGSSTAVLNVKSSRTAITMRAPAFEDWWTCLLLLLLLL
jgi:hypothetical protein